MNIWHRIEIYGNINKICYSIIKNPCLYSLYIHIYIYNNIKDAVIPKKPETPSQPVTLTTHPVPKTQRTSSASTGKREEQYKEQCDNNIRISKVTVTNGL